MNEIDEINIKKTTIPIKKIKFSLLLIPKVFRNLNKFFTNEIYGNHLTPYGNKYVSKIIYNFLKQNCNEFI